MGLDKTKRKLLRLYLFFAFLLLVVMPMLHFFFVKGQDTFSRLAVAFVSQRLSIAAVVMALVLVLMVIRTNFRFREYSLAWKYLVLGMIFFSLSFITFSELNPVLKQGVGVDITKSAANPGIDFDIGRLFNERSFNTQDNGARFLEIERYPVRKILHIEDSTKDTEISYIIYSKNFTEANFSLTVNEFTLNITGLKHDSDIKNLKFKVDKTMLAKENTVEIEGKGISVLYTSLFPEGRTSIYSPEEDLWKPVDYEAIIYVRGENTLLMDILFKLGIVFRLAGSISLFIFLFGLEFSGKCLKRYRKETIASLIFTLLLFLLLSMI